MPFLAGALGLGWEDPARDRPLLEFVVGVLTLHRTYYLVDALLLYVLLFSVAGLAIALMAEGKTLLVLALSWGVWLGWQAFPGLTQVPWPIDGMEVFQPAAWQVLYFTCLAMGFHRAKLGLWLRRTSARAYVAASGLGLTASVVLYQHEQQLLQALAPGTDAQTLAGLLFSKADVRVGRLLAFMLVATLTFSLATLAWSRVESWLGWLLIPLGQHSLTAYVLHIGVVLSLTKLGRVAFGAEDPGRGPNMLLELTGVFAVWLLVQLIVAAKQWRQAAAAPPAEIAPILRLPVLKNAA